MKFSYKFSNLLGTVYHRGNVTFSKDGTKVISPVGNRVSIFDLKSNKSSTLPVESRYNITALDLSPDGSMLIAADEVGEAYVVSMVSNAVVYTHSFKMKINAMKFSPNGRFFAVCRGNRVLVFRVPGEFGKEFNPFIVHRTFFGATGDTVSLNWTTDSRIVIVGSKDGSARLYGILRLEGFRICSLSSHNEGIVSAFFDKNSLNCYTACSGGRLCVWEANLEPKDLKPEKKKEVELNAANLDDALDTERGEAANEDKAADDAESALNSESKNQDSKLKYKLVSRSYLRDHVQAELKSASYHSPSKVLVAGFANGTFLIVELPEINIIHSLNISSNPIANVVFNSTGDWIAIGCEDIGQLVVWEWQSETYIMNQQGHTSTITSLCYSPDGQFIVTGGVDGEVKLWNTLTGFCFKTFTDHAGPIAAVKFARNKKFVVSASLDGSVRTFDLTRYRNFRTFTAHKPVQFFSLAIDSSCEFVAAGGQNVFEIFLWSIKIGKLVEVLSGHQAPVPSLDFSPKLTSTELASVSWDKTLRIWNAIDATTLCESVQLSSDATSVAYKPDGKEVAVTTLDGQICTFEVSAATQTGNIAGRNDLGSGRTKTDLVSAKKSLEAKGFLCVSFSPDGSYVLCAGHSKNICLYSMSDAILLRKFVITQNRSLDGVDDFINRRYMTEFGNMALLERREEGFVPIKLPGVTKGDMAARRAKPEIRVFSLQFSPTGQEWAAATTEGLVIYSLGQSQIFDPFHLTESITPTSILESQKEGKFTEAVMMALRLNEKELLKTIVESVPPDQIQLCVTTLPDIYKNKLLEFIAPKLENSCHLQFYLAWIKELLCILRKPDNTTLVMIQRSLQTKHKGLSKVCNFNKYSLQFLCDVARSFDRKSTDCSDGIWDDPVPLADALNNAEDIL